MVKLTLTIAAAVAAAAVIVEGSSDPGSPLSPHSQFLRDGRSTSSGTGLGPSDSDANKLPHSDFSRDLESPERGGMFRGGQHPRPPPDAGRADFSLSGSDEGGTSWADSGSFDGRFDPPPPHTGNGKMPPFPDNGSFRKGHPKHFGDKKPGNRNPPPSDDSKSFRGHFTDNHPGHGDLGDHFTADKGSEEAPALSSGFGSWPGSGSDARGAPPPPAVGDDFGPPFPWQDGAPVNLPPSPKQGKGEASKRNIPDGKQPPSKGVMSGGEGKLPDHFRPSRDDFRSPPPNAAFHEYSPDGEDTNKSGHDSDAGSTAAPLTTGNLQ